MKLTWEQRNPDKVREQTRRSRSKKREWLNSLKDAPCEDCGHQFPPECMDWDHVRGRKLFCVGYADTQHISRERVIREIAKCDLVCANCHRIRTTRRARARSKTKR